MLGDDPRAKLSWPSLIEKRGGGVLPCFPGPQSQCHMGSSTSHNWKADEKTPSGSQIIQIKDANSDLDSQQLTQSGLLVARKKRVHAQVTYLIRLSIFTCNFVQVSFSMLERKL